MYRQLYGRASKILTQGCPLAIFFHYRYCRNKGHGHSPKSNGSQESTISEFVKFGDITFFCLFFWLTIFEFGRGISWSPAFAGMKIVVIALCHLLREASIRKETPKYRHKRWRLGGGGAWGKKRTKLTDKLQSAHHMPKIQPYLSGVKKVSQIISLITFCFIDALYELLKEVKGGPQCIEVFNLAVMPIVTRA